MPSGDGIRDKIQVVFKELTRDWIKSLVSLKPLSFVEKVKTRENCVKISLSVALTSFSLVKFVKLILIVHLMFVSDLKRESTSEVEFPTHHF